MAKDNEEKKIQLKPYTAKNVIDARNSSTRKLNKKAGKTVADLWAPKFN